MRRRGGLVGGLILSVSIAAVAHAQQIDPSARYDIDEVMRRHPHDVSELPDAEEMAGRRVRFEASLAGGYSNNAAATRSDRIGAASITPGLGLDIAPGSFGGWNVGAGALADGDYYSGGHNDDLAEARLEGFLFAEHELGEGALTLELIALGVFSDDFSDQQFWLGIADATYEHKIGPFDAEVSAEYQDSDVPELRRTRLTGVLAHTLEQPQFGYALTFEGDVAFSDFNGGLNANRNDVTAALAMIAERTLSNGFQVEGEAAFVKRFSNRELSRFSAVEVSVKVSRAF